MSSNGRLTQIIYALINTSPPTPQTLRRGLVLSPHKLKNGRYRLNAGRIDKPPSEEEIKIVIRDLTAALAQDDLKPSNLTRQDNQTAGRYTYTIIEYGTVKQKTLF